jgi:hypothetical protein
MAKRRSYGRIKKTPGKLYEQKFTSRGMTSAFPLMSAGKRSFNVKVFVQRNTGKGATRGEAAASSRANYEALACINKAAFRRKTAGCGKFAYGRTVQSAVAKALKSLATKTALRGRKD